MLLDMTFHEIAEHANRQQAILDAPLERASGFESDDMKALETPFRSVAT